MIRFQTRSLALPTFLALALAACSSSGSAPVETQAPALTDNTVGVEHRTYDARTFFETTSQWGSSFSHDETKILLTSDATGVFNLWAQPVAGGDPEPITSSTDNAIRGIGWFPDDDRLIYASDVGGNELDHVYVRETDGRTIDLTPGGGLKAGFARWSDDGTAFFVTSNERDARFFDVYRYTVEGTRFRSYPRELLFENDGWAVSGVSGDGRWIALTKVFGNKNNDLFLYDTQSPQTEPVKFTEHEGDRWHQGATFRPGTDEYYYLSDTGGEFMQLWLYDVSDGDHEQVLTTDWDVSSVSFSRDGRYRIVGTNEDARTALHVFDTRTGTNVALPDFPAGDIAGARIADSGTKMAFYLNGDTSPSDLYVMDMPGGAARRLTRSLSGSIMEDDLVASEVVRYPSFDDLRIPALLYKPKAASADARVPALVWVHGGPGGQSRTGYRAVIQFLVNHGYAVLAVNNRGSSGYGRTFYHLDDRRHGEDDLQDCIYGRKYLATLDWIDDERVGIIGGSYGGYMVAAALTFQPQAFELGIDIFGVTNWLRTIESIPPWWEEFRSYLIEEIGDPATDRDRLQRISPLFHASNVQRPLLVVQGANDPRVLQAESDELVAAVRANGVPVEYVLFPDEGHGFRNKENRITAAEAYLTFLDTHLKAPRAK